MLAGVENDYDCRLNKPMRQTFYSTDAVVIVESGTLMCFDALVVTSSGCTPPVRLMAVADYFLSWAEARDKDRGRGRGVRIGLRVGLWLGVRVGLRGTGGGGGRGGDRARVGVGAKLEVGVEVGVVVGSG